MSTANPLIESFRILGLHGYKDLSIEFQGPTRIVIAENGAGKTTILSALHAFLRADFHKIRSLRFRGREKELSLRRSQLPEVAESAQDVTLAEWARFAGADATELRRAILGLDMSRRIDVRSVPILEAVYYNSPMDEPEMLRHIKSMRAELDKTLSEEVKALAAEIRSITSGYEVLYLPTYRRVELPLAKREASRFVRRHPSYAPPGRGVRPGMRSKWSGYGIQFGLADVEERLNDILSEIQRESNLGYRVISANIIDELLAARRFAAKPKSSALPSIEALSLFFSRIETSGSRERLAEIKELYDSGAIDSDAYETLRYFLTKLSRVVDKTRELESNIERFVEKVNDYLRTSSDEKELHYDAVQMKVLIRNLWTNSGVQFDDLSSGEKQVVSILAHLYLYQEQKIVLIDEPELSLSMDWQKRLLPDVVDSPTCAQLLAITHSPFIFDNKLDPFAGPLAIDRRRRV